MQLYVDVDYSILIPSPTMARVNYVHVYVTSYTACLACEIEVIMRVRVRLCLNVCVSRSMGGSWQLCITMLGLARISSGIVAGGLSEALG